MGPYRWFVPILTFALAAQTFQSFQQQPQASEAVIRINVNLVQVDAIVKDSKDHPVTDLKAEDFIVLQDGKPQKLSNCFYIDTRESNVRNAAVVKPSASAKGAAPVPPPPPVALKAGQIRRTIALLVDDLGLSFESTAHVRDSLRKWVDREMQPGDLVAVIRTGAGMGALQQFTSDKRILHAAIERVKYNSLGRVGISAFAPLGNNGPLDTTEFDEQREQMISVGSMGAIRYVVDG